MPKVKREKKKPEFRVDRKKYGFTYSALVEAETTLGRPRQPILNCEELRDHLQLVGGACQFTVAVEKHADGALHYHAHVTYDKKYESTNSRCFDFKGIHPNICQGGPGWENYVRKAGEFITNKHSSVFARAVDTGNLHDAMALLRKEAPDKICQNGKNIAANLESHYFPKPAITYKTHFGPYPEKWYPIEWFGREDTHSLLLWGKPGLGKTNFARYLLGPDHFYWKKSLEGLRQLGDAKQLLFDDVYMHDLNVKPADSRELTDVLDGGNITARYGDIVIPPGVRKIFTSNYEFPFHNPMEAVYGRRVISHKIE